MTDKVQKIREEVERLMTELIQEKEKCFGSDIDDACILELQNVLTYIDSLQEEPKTDWLQELQEKLDSMSKEDFEKVFDKYAIDFNEEPVSDDLEAEIEKYCIKHGYLDSAKDCGFTFNEQVGDIARHFAKWQKEQMMANTADAMIGLPYENKDGGYTHLIDVSRPLPVGNNKIAIIFKED